MSIKDCPLGLYEKALPFTWGWEQKLGAVKELGFDFMELSVDPAHIERLSMTGDEIFRLRDMSERLGVPIPTLALSANRNWPLGSKGREKREAGKALLKDAIAFAQKLGVRVVQVAAYDVYGEPGDEETSRLFAESLKECERAAALSGVMLALETMDGPHANSVSSCKGIVDKIGSPWVQIYADAGNIAEAGIDFAGDVAMGAGHIVAVHLKDTKPGMVRRVDYGTGLVDFDAVFRILNQADFRGFLVAEMWCDDNPSYVGTVRAAHGFLREKIRAACEAREARQAGAALEA